LTAWVGIVEGGLGCGWIYVVVLWTNHGFEMGLGWKEFHWCEWESGSGFGRCVM
jgi:hypothetical protein